MSDEKWEVKRPDGMVVKFTTSSIKRLVKPRKFKAGTEQYQLAWRISHNIKSYEDAKASGHGVESLRQQILDELGKLVTIDAGQAESRSV